MESEWGLLTPSGYRSAPAVIEGNTTSQEQDKPGQERLRRQKGRRRSQDRKEVRKKGREHTADDLVSHRAVADRLRRATGMAPRPGNSEDARRCASRQDATAPNQTKPQQGS